MLAAEDMDASKRTIERMAPVDNAPRTAGWPYPPQGPRVDEHVWGLSTFRMSDISTTDSEPRFVAALRRAARALGGPVHSIDVADALLDERRELVERVRNQRCATGSIPVSRTTHRRTSMPVFPTPPTKRELAVNSRNAPPSRAGGGLIGFHAARPPHSEPPELPLARYWREQRELVAAQLRWAAEIVDLDDG
jgi:hypothetical protein